MDVSRGPKGFLGCRTELLRGHGPASWLPGLPLLLGPVAQHSLPPAEWQLSQTLASLTPPPPHIPHFPQPGPNKGKTKIHFPLSEFREGEWGESHLLLCSGAHTAPYISWELKIHTEF